MGEIVKDLPGETTTIAKVSFQSWLVVGGCFMSLLVGPGLVTSTFSVFFATLLESLPWSRATTAFAYSLHIAIYGFMGPVSGRLCETLGPRRVFLSGAVLIAGGFALLSLVQEVWQFCLLYSALGVATALTGMIPVTVLISRWFSAKRGLALGLAFSGVGMGGFFLAPLAHLLITHLGWRQAYLLLGGGASLALFGAVLATVQDAPEGKAERGGTGEDQPALADKPAPGQKAGDLTLRETMGTKSFWLLTGAGLLFFGVLSSVFAHVVPLALDRGLAKGPAALSLGLVLGMGTVGKVGMGHLADRFEGKRVLLGTFLLQGLAILFVVWGEMTALFWAFVILFGIGQGGALTLPPLVMGKLFGNNSLGSIVGIYLLIATTGSLVGPPAAGAIRDATGTYFLGLVSFAAAMFGATLLVGLIRDERPSEKFPGHP